MRRPEEIAVSHDSSEIAPKTDSICRSDFVISLVSRAFQAGIRLRIATLTTPRKIAGNLISRNGLPTYSLPFVVIRQTPLVTATMKPAVAMGTVGRVIAPRGPPRQNHMSRKSRQRRG